MRGEMKLILRSCVLAAVGFTALGCNPRGACISKDTDHCSHPTQHGCATTMGGNTPGEFHANKKCAQVGYTYNIYNDSWSKPPVR